MKITLVIFIFEACLVISNGIEEDHALFYKKSDKNIGLENGKNEDSKEMDKRVEQLLLWLQNKYKEKSRKTRDDLSRIYLPTYSTTTQEPRPFQSYGFKVDTVTTRPLESSLTTIDDISALKPALPELNRNFGSQIDDAFTIPKIDVEPGQNAVDGDGVGGGHHPPHIHDIRAECSKDQMTVNIEFNTVFNGLIYSKGHYNSNECRYVTPNSGQKSYKFTLLLNSCGTQFIDRFAEGEQAYLENTLVIQNEPGILEAWDSEHGVRCLWEGKISQSLSSGLNIGSLEQQLLTFNGDTGKARLEIQVGRGPFSYTDKSLVQLGDMMTLVITVEGDPQFNLKIGQCISTSSAGSRIMLTDANGCPLREKLMGAFQFTRNPNDGAPIAFAFFKAFKFPDEMDINFECHVELCKIECNTCQKPGLVYEPTRRRRFISSFNSDSERQSYYVNNTIRIYTPKDLIKT
ncbi:cuticlin-3-like isoform X1 [Rhodnius prolixus]|uniref:cuticlin-3-like isoform X1 n=1 Tax=Rhodnius prolixus TaxID=13249 RepID=UPI003D189524